MPKYLIERRMLGAGKVSAEELRGASQTSNEVLANMQKDGKNVQWVESYVTDDSLHQCGLETRDFSRVRNGRCCEAAQGESESALTRKLITDNISL
jgi:hypothetical protein